MGSTRKNLKRNTSYHQREKYFIYFTGKMSSGDVVRCKVCNAACEQRGYNIQRTCRSCQEFYQRSVQKMNSSSSFSYTCNCAQNCEARNSVMCNIGSDGKR